GGGAVRLAAGTPPGVGAAGAAEPAGQPRRLRRRGRGPPVGAAGAPGGLLAGLAGHGRRTAGRDRRRAAAHPFSPPTVTQHPGDETGKFIHRLPAWGTTVDPK